MNCQFFHSLRQRARSRPQISACALLWCALAWTGLAQAQQTALPTPQSGIWVVNSPLQAGMALGRSLAIDVQDGVLLAQIGDYDAQGKPTFLVTAGSLQPDAQQPLSVSAMQAPLQQYQGGRAIGGPAQSAQLLGSTGEVQLRFTSSFTGTAQFPGEPALPIERIQLDTLRHANPDVQTLDAFRGQLHGVTGPPNLLPDASFLLSVVRQAPSGQRQLKLTMAQQVLPQALLCETPSPTANSHTAAVAKAIGQTLQLQCTGQLQLPELRIDVQAQLEIAGNEVVGQLQYRQTDAAGQTQSANANLRGVRHFYETNHLRSGESWYYAYSNADMQYLVPQSGIWVIPEELNGEPGRGFAIDVEGDTLALQVFGYEPSGDATFHIGSSPFVPGHISQVALRQPFASTQQNPGIASLSFDSMTSGTMALPGEPARKIVRIPLSGPPDAQALSGLWRFDRPGQAALSVTLSQVHENSINSDDGLFSCAFVAIASTQGLGNTLCTLSPAPEDAEQSPLQFIFNWELGIADFYGQALDRTTGAATGTGISRIAYLGRNAAASHYFSVGSKLYLPLRIAPQ